MSYGYVRFINSVGSPGNAGTNIAKARVRTTKEQTIAKDEEMAEMFVDSEEGTLVLRALRQQGKRTVVAERRTPMSNVIDLEPLPEAPPEPTKKGNAQ